MIRHTGMIHMIIFGKSALRTFSIAFRAWRLRKVRAKWECLRKVRAKRGGLGEESVQKIHAYPSNPRDSGDNVSIRYPAFRQNTLLTADFPKSQPSRLWPQCGDSEECLQAEHVC